MIIYFDMDGTIANLYSNPNWLNDIHNFNTRPYEDATELVNEKELLELIAKGYELGIISWLAGYHNNKEYDKKVRIAKKNWLKEHYPNITFKEIHIVKYGTPKEKVANHKNDILVDDELKNRNNWLGLAIKPNEINNL